MKKILLASLLVLGLFVMSSPAQALTTKDLLKVIGNLQTEVSSLRDNLGAAVVTSPYTFSNTATVGVTSPNTLLPVSTTAVTGVSASNITVGSTNTSAVTTLQNSLKAAGYTLTTDGKFGAQTLNAVTSIQTKYGLPVNGIVDTATLSAINTALSAKNATSPTATSASVNPYSTSASTNPYTTTKTTTTTTNPYATTTKTSTVTIPPNPNTAVSLACISTMAPWIQVLSPNGGEIYTVGQSIPVKWTSCNISKSATIITVFNYVDSNDHGTIHNSGSQSLAYVPNSGSTTIIPPASMTKTLGKHYTITLVYQPSATGGVDVRDSSDNLFTINNTSTPSITVTSPNGGETYAAGQQITVKWKTNNYPQGKGVNIFLTLPSNNFAYGLLTNTLNDGVETVSIPTPELWLKNVSQTTSFPMPLGNYYKIWIDNNGNGAPLPSNNNFGDDSDNLFTINNSSTSVCNINQTGTGSYTLSNKNTPMGAVLPAGFSNNLDVSYIVFTNTGSQPVCITDIQLGSLVDPSKKFKDINLYDENGTSLGSYILTSNFYNVPNSTSWAYWVNVKIPVMPGQTKNFHINIDPLASSSITPGLINLGISGLTFSSPGASGSALSFGNPFAVN